MFIIIVIIIIIYLKTSCNQASANKLGVFDSLNNKHIYLTQRYRRH